MNDAIPSNLPAEVLTCTTLCKSFVEGGRTLTVLDEASLVVRRGERVAIIGASGAGKTTLLQLLGGLDVPTTGEVRIAGKNITAMNEIERGHLRNELLGFVYQFHHLLPEFSALENVAMPLFVRRVDSSEALTAARAVLERVGLGERLDHKPSQLSGGERQRAAVARALVTRPALVLADEPTGNLDAATGGRVFDLVLELNEAYGTSLVVVTHDHEIAARMDRVLELSAGKLHEFDKAAL